MWTIAKTIFGYQRVTVAETQRMIWLQKGRVQGILGPGEHWLGTRAGKPELVRMTIVRPIFQSELEKALFDRCGPDAERHLTVARTDAQEVAVVEQDGQIFAVLGPDSKQIYWTDAGPWSVHIFSLAGDLAVETGLLRRLLKARKAEHVAVVQVPDGHAAVLFIDGTLDRVLTPGVYGFWKANRVINASVVDLRWRSQDVAGQEVLTRDRVTVRLNIAAEYRVTDAVKAVSQVKDFADAFYRALQVAFRKTVGAMTLDQVLERKGEVDADALTKVRADMSGIGIEVRDIVLKDVILPGEMREILNKVVTAQKEAEANVIRRREETNATRSLLNTAKVMADNPVMLRLKELEAIESIAAKVDKLTITNGTDGLLKDLVRLSD